MLARIISQHHSNGIALNNLDKAGNCLGTGIGIVFVLLGWRIVDGNPGFQGEPRAQVQSPIVQQRNKADISDLNETP